MMCHQPSEALTFVLEQTLATFRQLAAETPVELAVEEIGRVTALGQGIAHVKGLPRVKSEELLQFPGGELGLAFNLDEDDVGVVMLDDSATIQAGYEVQRTQRVMDVPVGEALLGRVVDAMGRALDDRGAIPTQQRWPIEREAPSIMERAPVSVPLQTGIKVIDALIPIGRGQRELIVGDRQTGKTELAIDIILNQRDQNVICVYCAIAQRGAAVAKLVADLRQRGVMDYCVVVAAAAESPAGLQYITPFAATTIAEYFMAQGQDVLIIYDDLIQHARAYRALSLLLRRPPGREAFPGDIFYLHARLLERSTHLGPEGGGGSLTALPIIATEAQNLAAYIPTNLVSITDGQIVLSPELFQKGIFPAVDVGKSVSRVGGKVQLPAYRAVVGDLRLSYAQFQELEVFARFGTRLDESTRRKLARGRRVREVLKQTQHELLPVAEQIALLLALNQGLLDEVPLDRFEGVQQQICQAVRERLPDVYQRIQAGEALAEGDCKALLETVKLTLASKLEEHHANP